MRQPSIARTYRVAAKIGDDYHTLEEVVTLPLDATDADIAQAVAVGQRIYAAQQAAVSVQLATLRAALPVPARSPSKAQLTAVGKLRAKVSVATVAAVYKELAIEGAEPATVEQASVLIGRLGDIVDGRAADPGAASFMSPASPPTEAESNDLPF